MAMPKTPDADVDAQPAAWKAFESSVVTENFGKRIQALEVWGEQLLAGLVDGTLVVFAPAEAPADSTAPWQVQQALKHFGKRYILQLEVLLARGLLLSLGEDGVNAHRLPSFQLTAQASRTRGATCFAWDELRAMLAVGLKKRLLLFHYTGTDFVELKDVALAEAPLTASWAGNYVCLACKAMYLSVHAQTGAVQELCNVSKDSVAALRRLPSGDVLLAKDSTCRFVGGFGKLLRRPAIVWSQPPLALAYCQPVAIAVMSEYVEVRPGQSSSSGDLSQQLPLAGMSVISPSLGSDGSLFLASASDAGIRRLTPVPFLDQARALAALCEYEDALAMCALLPRHQDEERAELESELHMRVGIQLFAEGDYDEAMSHVGMCSRATPLLLLSLFPSLAPRVLLEPVIPCFPAVAGISEGGEPTGEAYRTAVSMLLPYLLSWRTRLSSVQQVAESDEEAEGEFGQESSPKPAGPLDRLSQLQHHQLAVLLDTAMLKAMLAVHDTGQLLRFVQRGNDVDLVEGRASLTEVGRYSELVALLQARGCHEAALDVLKTLSQSPQTLEVEPAGAATDLLGLPGVWAAVKYLRAVSPPDINLIKRHARWVLRADPEAGLDMLVYLQPPLPPETVLLVLRGVSPALCAPYLEAALAANVAAPKTYDTELGVMYLQVLLESPASDSTDAEAKEGEEEEAILMAPFPAKLEKHDAFTKLKQLIMASSHLDSERMLRMLPAAALLQIRALLLERTGRHDEILRIYVHQMGSQQLAEEYCDRVYEKALLEKVGHLKGGKAFGTLAFIAGHAEPGDYDIYLKLVQVYLQQGQGIASRGGSKNSAQPSTIESTAVGGAAVLNAGRNSAAAGLAAQREQSGTVSETQSERWKDVAKLLSRKHDRIDPLHALSLLPDGVPLASVLPFLEGALRGAGEQRRNASIIKSLRRSENLQCREVAILCRQRRVVITSERACSLCHKRIGSSAFVGQPDGVLQHYSCWQRTSKDN